MTILWSAVLAAAVSIVLPASSMAYTKHPRAEQVRGHSLGGTCAKNGTCAKKARTASKTSPARASADLIEPDERSKSLSSRILFRKTGSHFCGECSRASSTARIGRARTLAARDPSGLALTAGVVKPLADKAAEIVAACGARVISGVRHTRVAGTRTMSLHASGQAIDMRGNPACIYRHLQGWPGGYTTDYGRAQHVHISYGGREHGLRFAHGGKSPSRKATRNIQIARR
ncbi:hypothetical protein [Blastochloris sulfoviridis]|uniref:DUF882 domain-containing protein n=1 Tax=Blastochloris sulfoviridis TaxID=50712 RepID=A0A5M6I5N9_9HYPH|nr:hypothetical protein [Blastochloris sulfoviridis]KAA5603088.1 hypothetical protein F1193_02345 [Blastochloris sulfoviridis]